MCLMLEKNLLAEKEKLLLSVSYRMGTAPSGVQS